MSATNTNRVSHFWALGLQAQIFDNPMFTFGCFLWQQYKILASYNKFCKFQGFYLCAPLLTLTQSSFSSTYLLKFSSSKTFVARWSVSVVIPFAFLGAGFGDILPTFLFYVKFEQGIQRYQNILNSTFETIYQVRG